MRPRKGWLVAIACGALLACGAGSARATTFGIPLGTAPFNAAPGYTYDCSVFPDGDRSRAPARAGGAAVDRDLVHLG